MEDPNVTKRKKTPPIAKKVNKTRRNAQATRTLRACDLCRKQKTRCFRVDENSNSCLRCSFLNKPCSFAITAGGFRLDGDPGISGASDTKKLDLIYSGVNEILRLIKSKGPGVVNDNDARLLLEAANTMKDTSIPPGNNGEEPDHEKMVTNPIDLENQSTFQSPTNSLEIAPFQIVNNQLKPEHVPKNIENLLSLSSFKQNPTPPGTGNIISLNLIPFNEVIHLMNDFRRNYGRWISFPSNLPTEILIERLTNKSPLLLTTCCVLSLRYSFNNINPGDINNLVRKRLVFNSLVKQLAKEMNLNLMRVNCFKGVSGDIELLQSLVILAIYSSSLTSIISSNCQALVKASGNNSSMNLKEFNLSLNDFNLDPWFLSGLGLNLFVSKVTFGSLIPKENIDLNASLNSPFTILYDEELDSNEYQILTLMRIYNHLVLVHIINCVFSGRMCIVDEIRLNNCNMTLGLPSSTNFDGRMVSEISILLITYNFIQLNTNMGIMSLEELNLNLGATIREIQAWYDQWEYLLQQPALQFVEVCYNFCNLLIYYTYNYQKHLILNNLRNLNATSDMFNEDNLKFIMNISSPHDKVKMFEYSNNIMTFINLINNDSYFAHLSDQLQFCFYFAGLFLLKFLYILRSEDNLRLVDLSDVNDMNSLGNIKTLISKFNNINNLEVNDSDIITKFKISLKHQFKKLFPEFS
ncbi:hypothetical protein PSN45_001857 [Yamadazyma tenuis]|uniref:Zn(2)-C6 fungal-type domain-containing protein n=1 Tax=Candida tenuis (strain ATCC 10573 / BCRC 21748 / CBS 615 / JCM 9827 / NBRC 10315 / NRRL Y-1498 / VKM Y-70) TaxID=590646 RepID=G3BDU4_CANTC|nr:uncharacterized protein CANTEDRAFT_127572 [Yamadazyma tenuis ATCC 10573]EGV60382.1 hypothetical protein CANTEDRAFT_127572 [Yamadazyma tenuis ATCC 10573]WEJ94373.1 hypothetical protein PSN45_001857 [Yamadazyma tenuis]